MPIPNNQENAYVDAFWDWFPSMYKNLKYFRITGGEPLLNKNTFKVLDYIIANPNPDLEVAINTNMNPPTELFNKFLEKVKIIVNENKLKRFKLFTSAEAHGKQSDVNLQLNAKGYRSVVARSAADAIKTIEEYLNGTQHTG